MRREDFTRNPKMSTGMLESMANGRRPDTRATDMATKRIVHGDIGQTPDRETTNNKQDELPASHNRLGNILKMVAANNHR